jgi:hypothetical protein
MLHVRLELIGEGNDQGKALLWALLLWGVDVAVSAAVHVSVSDRAGVDNKPPKSSLVDFRVILIAVLCGVRKSSAYRI